MLTDSSGEIYWVSIQDWKVTESTMRNFNIRKFHGGQMLSRNPEGAKFCVWLGKDDRYHDSGTEIVDRILPLVTAFGETVNAQIS